MDSDKWEIVHIPEKPTFEHDRQPTVNVYASVIQPKSANTLVRQLGQIAPLGDLRHVKRVRKKTLPDQGEIQLTVILCLAPEHGDHLNSIPPNVQDLVTSYELSPFTTEVCKYAAVSKEEWEEQCKIWPTSYHPPTYNIDGIGGFSEDDAQSICSFMRVVIDLAVSHHNPLVNAAVIVDPSVRRIIASETDQVYPSAAPNQTTSLENRTCKETETAVHCQSNGVTNVGSKTGLNGVYERQKDSKSAVACLNPWHWSMQQHNIRGYGQWHPLKHAPMVAIESSSARDRDLFPNTAESFGPDRLQPSVADSPAKKQKTNIQSLNVQNDSKEDGHGNLSIERPYLCTGYDIFMLYEPCTMCAMALVHQRIKRIFYAYPNPVAGGLGSIHRLQGEKSLNHHYAVFRVLVPDAALGLSSHDHALKHVE